jgi:hypothetical protein
MMLRVLSALLAFAVGLFRSRASLCLENLAPPVPHGSCGVHRPAPRHLALSPEAARGFERSRRHATISCASA